MERRNKTLRPFEVQSVALQDRNLIEASAGTGKTYSIAILVLRLILEKKISINNILMVTFTKAAVAELEERIRAFVRNAYKIANGDQSISDPTLIKIVTLAIDRDGKDEVIELLKEAKLLLDETAVMTIHSFCQVTLNEFSLETKQLFGADMLQDLSLLINEQVDIFWREQITILHPLILQCISEAGFNRASISKIMDKSLGGQRYVYYQPGSNNLFTHEDETIALNQLKEINEKIRESWDGLVSEFMVNRTEIMQQCDSDRYAQKSLLPLVDSPSLFLEQLYKLKDKGYTQKLFPEWLEKLNEHEAVKDARSLLSEELIRKLYVFAIDKIGRGIQKKKEENGLLSFDDLITNLFQALHADDSSKLIEGLREKYKAVFIDEFQDTDRQQYQLFNTAFGEGTITFYIGDPKQSIYAWRQADINTYFKAGKEVEHRYGMNVNFRSSRAFIDSMNLFFSPHLGFDTFNYNHQEDGISYIPVEAPKLENKWNFTHNSQAQPGITIFLNTKVEEINDSVAKQVLLLLTDNGYIFKKNGIKKEVRPADIGILVRSNAQGEVIKNELTKYGIPAITIDTNKVLETSEARHIYYLLKAIIDSNKYTISRALLSPFTGFKTDDLKQIDFDKVFLEFGLLKQTWQELGIYAALTNFMTSFNVKETLLQSNARRTLTNTLQIIEILHKIQSQKNLSALELLSWLKMASEGLKMEGDEYEQRIESDQEAVEIVTIHKSKGLEYPIVFAPFLDLKTNLKGNGRGIALVDFKGDDGEYVFSSPDALTQEQEEDVLTEQEQENRRLIYVAISRAAYKCYINKNTSSRSGETSLTPFIDALKDLPEESIQADIEFAELPEIETGARWRPKKVTETQSHKTAFATNFQLRQKNWVKMSYTFLARKPEYISRDNQAINLTDYEYFIFKQLIRGSVAGNFLHYIFENIDFTTDSAWEVHIQNALSRYLPSHDISPMITVLIHHVLNSTISNGADTFNLSTLPKSQRLNELEFDFNVSPFHGWQFNQLSNKEHSFAVRTSEELEGMMNGKIDMLFQQGSRFYILDWKSNFLGDSLMHYEPDKLQDSMTENNYHLQYLIYVVAVKKYLEQRLPNFDYERDFGGVIYVFIRGVRAGERTGIFTNKPSIEYINKIEQLLCSNNV